MTNPILSPDKLKKELKLFDVFAISTGAMFSSGFFLLPGLAAEKTGASVILAYLLAGILILPAMFSMAELSTAMPRAGGAYYFLDRSLGPLFGTIGGLGTYIALTLKTAFALVGIGAYAALYVQLPIEPVAIALTLAFMVLNIMGAKETTGLQRVLVTVLLTVLVYFIVVGLYQVFFMQPTQLVWTRLNPFFEFGLPGFLSTIGFVFVSYAGLTKVASVAEEVQDPERNIPLGMILSLTVTSIIYALGVFILVEVLSPAQLHEDLTPIATAAANYTVGLPVQILVPLVVLAAVAAFASTGNAGLMSASRYPLAMARDRLISERFAVLGRFKTPTIAVVSTSVLVIFFIVALDEEGIAKLASAFQLFIFILLNMAVVVMRESKITSYDPGYRSPFYPWMQIFGVLTSMALILYMGTQAIVFTTITTLLCVAWYFYYAKGRVRRDGAIYHWFARLGKRQDEALDYELWQIMREKGLRDHDPFEELIARAEVIDLGDKECNFVDLVQQVSEVMAPRISATPDELVTGFLQETRIGWTPVSKGASLPSLLMFHLSQPEMVLVRSHRGIHVDVVDVHGSRSPQELIHAFFFLIGSEEGAKQHLRLLAELAERIDDEDFMEIWLAAEGRDTLKASMLQEERYLSFHVRNNKPSEVMIDKALRDIEIPQDTLIAMIRRNKNTIIPRGETIFRENDRLFIIGEPQGIIEMKDRYLGPRKKVSDSTASSAQQNGQQP